MNWFEYALTVLKSQCDKCNTKWLFSHAIHMKSITRQKLKGSQSIWNSDLVNKPKLKIKLSFAFFRPKASKQQWNGKLYYHSNSWASLVTLDKAPKGGWQLENGRKTQQAFGFSHFLVTKIDYFTNDNSGKRKLVKWSWKCRSSIIIQIHSILLSGLRATEIENAL